MPDWLFHWTHDDVFKEVLKVSIPALGSILAALIAWYGIRRTAKVTQETLENSKEATPPELLRLEKWSTILKDSEGYPKNLDIGIDTICSTYKDVLKRATVENRVKNMLVWDMDVKDRLLETEPVSDRNVYPIQDWSSMFNTFKSFRILLIFGLLWMMGVIIFIIRCLFTLIEQFIYSKPPSNDDIDFLSLISGLLLFVFLIFQFSNWIIMREIKEEVREKNLIKNISYRNCYYALRDVFLIDGLELVESPDEREERGEFEKTKEYKEWWDKVKEDHPEWTSWNYGLSISWDNNPDKAKTDESEPESPTLIQKLSRTKLFFKRA